MPSQNKGRDFMDSPCGLREPVSCLEHDIGWTGDQIMRLQDPVDA